MKRISLWLLATLSVLVLLFGYSTSTSGPSAATSAAPGGSSYEATTGSASSGSTSSGSTSSGSTGSGSTSSGSGSTKAATTKTVTGSVAQTQWGPVQVTITVAAGRITKVDVPVYPSGNGKDEEINSYALPVLTDETVKAQSASIDMVSGATVTSNGYLESLQSALDKAGL